MFADPQSVTISGTAITLPRTGSSNNAGQFLAADGNNTMSISHQYGKRTRRMIRLDNRKIAADPLNAAQNLQYSMSMYIVVDVPPVGYALADVQAIWTGFLANLSASSAANTAKFLGGES